MHKCVEICTTVDNIEMTNIRISIILNLRQMVQIRYLIQKIPNIDIWDLKNISS